MSGTFKWAVFGPGHIANKFAQALAGAPGAKLYAVASRDIGRARDFADKYGAEKAYGSYEEMANECDADAFYVATPNTLHKENTLPCLERGKAVLCEKPMAINAIEERKMVEAARKHGAFLMEAMWTRFLPAIRHANALIRDGAIGTPTALAADFSFTVPFNPASRLFDLNRGGGGLLDVGIYVMLLSSMVFGPKPVETQSFARIGPTGVDENASMILKYAGGGISSLTCGVHSLGTVEATISGTEGRITLPNFARAASVILAKGAETRETRFPHEVNGFEYEIREVMDCVKKGLTESPVLPLDESVAVMETMDGFRKSWGLVYPGEKV